ncbi:hypothetical protein AVEN_220437-1 [Araneus ventricosus]|uniref:Uncharacterized protein n=1 Tax=Araneus ventricosus TaxID=182803 RepID=A0A4Y2IQD4_ARAVE|nr:hypothetical protein AVEN_220437-1 [Araneus ventricosus]
MTVDILKNVRHYMKDNYAPIVIAENLQIPVTLPQWVIKSAIALLDMLNLKNLVPSVTVVRIHIQIHVSLKWMVLENVSAILDMLYKMDYVKVK